MNRWNKWKDYGINPNGSLTGNKRITYPTLGSALKDVNAGGGKKKTKREVGKDKNKKPLSKWIKHVMAVKAKTGLSYVDAMKEAKKTYKK